MRRDSIRIIGIDPGLRRTGWGVVESDGVRLAYVASGRIESDAGDGLALRLRALYEGLAGVIASLCPHEAAVEETFVSKDARATLKLGQARAMALRFGIGPIAAAWSACLQLLLQTSGSSR